VVGIPADLVRRRPDVRRAERTLAAQSARIGIAEAEFYPHIGLDGTIGVSAEDFDDLFDGSRSMVGDIGPFFQWNVLNYGRIASNVGIQNARFEQLAWAYQQQVLEAGREAEDGIITFLKSQESVRSLDASTRAAARTLQITIDQYQQGLIDYTGVYLFSSDLAAQQDRLAEAQGSVAQSLISLYRALGGGWEIRLNQVGPPVVIPPADESAMSEPLPVTPLPANGPAEVPVDALPEVALPAE
jgi:outer membrane protein TolC